MPRCEVQIGDIAGLHIDQMLMRQVQYIGPSLLLVGCCCRPCAMGLGGRVYLRSRSGVLNKTSSNMCGSWHLPMFLLRDGALTYEYGLLDGPGSCV